MTRWLFALALGGMVGLAVAPARANGRFPQTMSVVFKPGDDQKIWVGSTFGLLYSPDDGANWYWICETALGYQGIHDPVYAVTPTGTIFETIYDGLRVSRDGGCTWNLAGNGLDGFWFSDVQVAADASVWVSTQTTANPNDVWVSRDDGMTFTSTGLLRSRGFWKTLRVAPSDATRVYVTGYQMGEAADSMAAPTPMLFRTDNGTSPAADIIWTEIPWTHGGESQLKLLGVSRADPDIVFARVDEEPTDRVFRSDDGGVGWSEVLQFSMDDATAFVSSADGMSIVIGSSYAGSKISIDAGMTWNDLDGAPQMTCAGVRPADNDYFFCGANWEPDMMAFARSTDLATFTKVFRFVELDDAFDCADGTPQAAECEPNWCQTCDMFGCPDPVCNPTRDAPNIDGGTINPKGTGCCAVGGGRATVVGPIVLLGAAVLVLRGRRRGHR